MIPFGFSFYSKLTLLSFTLIFLLFALTPSPPPASSTIRSVNYSSSNVFFFFHAQLTRVKAIFYWIVYFQTFLFSLVLQCDSLPFRKTFKKKTCPLASLCRRCHRTKKQLQFLPKQQREATLLGRRQNSRTRFPPPTSSFSLPSSV